MQIYPFSPLFSLTRGGLIPEIVVFGASATKSQSNGVVGDKEAMIVTRSLLNPWQFCSCEIADMREFWTIGLALHSGQDMHLQALTELSQHAAAGEEELICPREYPIDADAQARLKLAGKQPRRFHHPNAGKHLTMLAACRHHDLDIESYWNPSHPIQKRLFGLVGKEAGEEVKWVADSCGLPTAAMTMRAHLHMWERFALDDASIASTARRLWLANPELIGGAGRLDSELCKVLAGHALVKEGADGLIVVQSLPTGEEPIESLLVKVTSGYHRNHMAIALIAAIQKHELTTPTFQKLRSHLEDQIKTWLRPDISLELLPTRAAQGTTT